MSVVWKPSHCPHCGHPIRARDNIPVLGWLILKGRCRDCGASISSRYAIVEAITGSAFFALAYVELLRGVVFPFGKRLSASRGAAEIVWNPDWPMLGTYAFHCVLLSTLVVVVLLRLDGNNTVGRFLVWLILLLLLWPLPLYFV